MKYYLWHSSTSPDHDITSLAKLKATHIQSHPNYKINVHGWMSDHVNLKRMSDHHNN
jgi:hypothetical protein